MEPNKIFNVMDLAQRARVIGEIFNPLFVGPPGVGKSHIVQAWAKARNVPFIDMRIAYMEAPDLIGFPSIQLIGERQVTVHNIPEFLPYEGIGVLLLEEPNRGTSSVMNCLMQLLTDRKIHKYNLPSGWIIASCINPEGNEYDVTTMDAALKDRFEMFQIDYDKQSLVTHMYDANWHKDVVNFVESNMWTYYRPEKVKNTPGSKYISPRTLSKLNAVLKAGFDREDEMMIYETVLGNNVAKDFFNFKHNESPVTMNQLTKNLPEALKKLIKFSDPNNYKGGMISITVKDIILENTISDDLLATVVSTIPVEKGTALIRDLEIKRKDEGILGRICKSHPQIRDLFRSVLKYDK